MRLFLALVALSGGLLAFGQQPPSNAAHSAGQVYAVRGRVELPVQHAGVGILEVGLYPQAPTVATPAMPAERITGTLHSDGSFEFAAVPPGAYYLLLTDITSRTVQRRAAFGFEHTSDFSASRRTAGVDNLWDPLTRITLGEASLSHMRVSPGMVVEAVAPVNVITSDLDGLVVPLSEKIDITGRVRVETTAKAHLEKTVIALAPVEAAWFGSKVATVNRDQTFELAGVRSGRYFPIVINLPQGTYLKSVKLNDQAAGKSMDLSGVKSPAKMEVTLRTGAATVRGVLSRSGKPAAGLPVTLVPEPYALAGLTDMKTVLSDEHGYYDIQGVAPGNYRLYAGVRPRPPLENTESLKPFEGTAVGISVRENERTRVDLNAPKP